MSSELRPLFKRAKFVAFLISIIAVVGMFIVNRLTGGSVETDQNLAFALTAAIGMFFPSQAAVDWKDKSLVRGPATPSPAPPPSPQGEAAP